MAHFNLKKLHVRILPGVNPVGPIVPRRYTLTQSSRTAHFYLAIGPEYHSKQLGGFYRRFMRNGVLGEWIDNHGEYEIHLYCHVSGGWVYGSAYRRNKILRKELPLTLQAIRYGDDFMCTHHPELDDTPVMIHFQSDKEKFNTIETWGKFGDYSSRRK